MGQSDKTMGQFLRRARYSQGIQGWLWLNGLEDYGKKNYKDFVKLWLKRKEKKRVLYFDILINKINLQKSKSTMIGLNGLMIVV